MCDGIVLNGTSITTVGQAEPVFGKDGIEWNIWCEDYACENSPRDGYGPHAPKPTDCLCYIDIVATAWRTGYDFHYLPNSDHDGDNECFYWHALTPRQSPFSRRMVASLGALSGFAACWVLILCLLLCISYLDREPAPNYEVDRFGIPKLPKKDGRDLDLFNPVYRYSCPDIQPVSGSC